MESSKRETLGNNVRPVNYELFFEPDFSTFEFEGKARIKVSIEKKTKQITLNSRELTIHEAYVRSSGTAQKAEIRFDSQKERVVLSFAKGVSGSTTLEIGFKGVNNDKLYGFYRSKYMDGEKEKHILTTQFEAASARSAFPCFDEPAFKATYDLSLLVPGNMHCISNMTVKKEAKQGEKKVVTFNTTPKMSSYLLYIGVGDFEVASIRSGRLTINCITVPGKKKYTALALGYTKRFIHYFEGYFGIRLPLIKMDVIAVPDFAAGAMENWGAITFRETALLAEEKAAIVTKQRIAEVIAHELTHQWFGDLVTMKWWDDLWLNESFATFMAYKAMDAVFPEWNMKVQYLDDVVASALAADQLVSTHPIAVTVNKPSDIDQIFDEISYDKGGSVLQMLEDYVGKETFRKGLNIYLRSNAYGNAQKEDLWNAIAKAAGKNAKKLDVAGVAKDWIEKKGYPYVELTKTNAKLRLTQSRFSLLDRKQKPETWRIPIRYTIPHNHAKLGKSVLMRYKTLELDAIEAGLKLNLHQTGFYRTLYSEEKLEELGELIKSGDLTWVDAWGIECDMYAFAKACKRTLPSYLKFVNDYCFASKYPLNMSALGHLNGLYNMLYNSKGEKRDATRKLLKEYSNDILKQVGWIRSKDEANTTTMIRSVAIVCSGVAGDKVTLNKANKLFSNFINSKQEIEPNLRGAIYTLAAWSGNEKTFKTLKERYMDEQVPDEKMRFLRSMAMFSDKKILKKALEFSLSKDVRYQDGITIPVIVSSRPAGQALIWPWTKKNWQELKHRYQLGTHMLGYFIDNLAVVSDAKSLREIDAFFTKRSNMRSDLTTPLKQAKEIIEINTRFMKYNRVS